MDSLPSEILCDIFQTVVDVSDPDTCFNFRSFAAPLWISHVSRRWREESLSSGSLWAYLRIEQSTQKSGSLKYIFDTCLQRTNGSPLYFTIHCYLDGTRDTEAHRLAEHMLTNMLAQQHRWRRVDLSWDSLNLSVDFQGCHATNMPLLISLKLKFSFKTRSWKRVFANVSIAQSRQLEELDLSGNFILHAGEEPIRTLKGPCSFKFSGKEEPGANMYLELVKIAPNLRELEVELDYVDEEADTGPDSAHDVVSENLEILRLPAGKSAPFIVRTLTLPALQELHYENGYEPTGRTALLSFVERSMPPLKLLEIYLIEIDEESLIPALRLLPTLEVLIVATFDDPTWLFEPFTLSDMIPSGRTSHAGDIICPRLGSFLIDGEYVLQNRDASLTAFCAMLESRWKVLKTFKTVWLDDEEKVELPFTSDQDYLKLQMCFDEGRPFWVGGIDAVDFRSFDV